MPALAAGLSALFGAFFSMFAKRLSLGLAAAAAFLTVSAATFAAVKLALLAVIASIGAIAPPALLNILVMLMPAHTQQYIGAILLASTIVTAFDYWRNNLAVAFQLANS